MARLKWWLVVPGVAALASPASVAKAEHEWVPVARLGVGPSLRVAPEVGASFVFDASVGATWLPEPIFLPPPLQTERPDGIIVNAEVGYTVDSIAGDLHAFHATAGLGYGVWFAGALVQPRLVVGRLGDQTAVGMRNGLRGFLFAETISLELAHQFIFADSTYQDVRIMAAFSPMTLLNLF